MGSIILGGAIVKFWGSVLNLIHLMTLKSGCKFLNILSYVTIQFYLGKVDFKGLFFMLN